MPPSPTPSLTVSSTMLTALSSAVTAYESASMIPSPPASQVQGADVAKSRVSAATVISAGDSAAPREASGRGVASPRPARDRKPLARGLQHPAFLRPLDHRGRSAIHPQRPARAQPQVSDIGSESRPLRLGTASGFTSEPVAAFRSELAAGFVGMRIIAVGASP